MILITGASGNVGSEVLKQAVAAKLSNRAAYMSADKAKGAPAGVETVLMDYAQPETIRAALNGIERGFLVGPPAANVAELEGSFVNEAKKSGVTNAQIAEKLSWVQGRTIRYVDVARDDFKKSLLSVGVPEWSANALIDLQRLYGEGGASLVDPACEQLRGRKATLFDDFARDYSFAFQQDARAAS